MHAPHAQVAPSRSIRFWLNCLVIACVVPAVIVATFIIFRSFTRERASFERDLVGTARALSQAVDAELKGDRSALLVLATSPYLASGDVARFYEEAQRVAHAINVDNIVLSELDGQQLVFAATDRRTVTEMVTADARRRGVWVNAADDPAFCDFLLPAVLRRGRLTVAVSTGGASPALAARVRNDLEAYLPPGYEELVELAAEVRAECIARGFRPGGSVWRGAFERDLVDLLAEGKRGEARTRLLDRLGATA